MPVGLPVLGEWMPFTGTDPHTGIMPGPPPVPVIEVLLCGGFLHWAQTERVGRIATTIHTPHGRMIMRGSDVGPLIPHAPVTVPPIPLLALIIPASTAKSQFGVHSVLGTPAGFHPAVGVLFAVGIQQDCGDALPGISAAVGVSQQYSIFNHSVVAGFTLGDLVGSIFAWAWESRATMLFDLILGFVAEKILHGLLKVLKGILDPVIELLEKAIAKYAEKILKGVIQDLLGWGLPPSLNELPEVLQQIVSGDGAFDLGHNLVDGIL